MYSLRQKGEAMELELLNVASILKHSDYVERVYIGTLGLTDVSLEAYSTTKDNGA